jgi:hypothetical protein
MVVAYAETGTVPGPFVHIVQEHLSEYFDAADSKTKCQFACNKPRDNNRIRGRNESPGDCFRYRSPVLVHNLILIKLKVI